MNNLYYNPKRLKKIKNKRTQKVKKVWGWILTIMGGMTLMSFPTDPTASTIIGALFFLVPGLLLLWGAKKQVSKWDRYEAIIDNHGNTSIPLIAERMGLSERTVYSDLQTMIHSDFFIGPNYNIEAYIDAEREMLVMTSGGRPLKPLPDLPKKEEAQAAPKPEPEPEVKPKEEIKIKMSDLDMIQKAIAETSDEEVRNYLYGIEGSVRRIDQRLKTQPQLKEKGSIRKLYRYYLPQIMELIRKYQAKDTPADLKDQIKDALKTSAGALANIEADLLERDQMNAEVDIEVLKNMFAQDGLLADKDGFGKGSAKPAGQAQTRSAGGTQTAQAAGGAAAAAQAQQGGN